MPSRRRVGPAGSRAGLRRPGTLLGLASGSGDRAPPAPYRLVRRQARPPHGNLESRLLIQGRGT